MFFKVIFLATISILCCDADYEEISIKDETKISDDLQFWKPVITPQYRRKLKQDNSSDFKEERLKLKTLESNSSSSWMLRAGKGKNRKSSKKMKRQRPVNVIKESSQEWPSMKGLRSKISTKLYEFQDAETEAQQQDYPEHDPECDKAICVNLNGYNIRNHLEYLFRKFDSVNVSLENIGRTAEYHDIVMVKITETTENAKRHFRVRERQYDDDTKEKKIIFIVHNLVTMGTRYVHCLREKMAFQHLVSIYLKHLEQFDIFLIPVANPDGFIHSAEGHWNKNMSPQEACPGVALDRNFDVSWQNNHNISSCSQNYPGPKPFSEAETRAIRSVLHKYSQKIIAYINVHAATYEPATYKGDAVLYPKGYRDNHSEEDKYIDLRGEIDEAINNGSFKILSVAVEPLKSWYGTVHGTSVDYASTVYSIPFALEFVMQTYASNSKFVKYPDAFSEASLTEVWGRVIPAVFDFIFKSQSTTNDVA